MKSLILVLHLITVHSPAGHQIEVNIDEISSIREVITPEEYHSKNTRCVLVMANGRIIGTREHCNEIKGRIAEVNK